MKQAKENNCGCGTAQPFTWKLLLATFSVDFQVEVEVYKTQDDGIDHVQFLITEKGSDVISGSHVTRTCDHILSTEPKISPETFCACFPFHVMFSRDMTITQAGNSISRVIPCLQDIETGQVGEEYD